MSIVLAEGLRRVGPGGGLEGECVRVTEVPLPEVHDWLEERWREGHLIDPKVYTGLYFIQKMRQAPRSPLIDASGGSERPPGKPL